jgi:hypothetical protein
VIVFDTNAIRLLDPEGEKASLLRVIKKAGIQDVAVPWMVLEELVAQRAVLYRQAWSNAIDALAKLSTLQPWPLNVEVGAEASDDVREYWRQQYRELFEVLPTSEQALRAAVIREANRLPPAKDNDKKEGARDVAIWLSVVDYLNANPDEEVYFVTNNTKDFGDGSLWPHPMDQDLDEMDDRLIMVKTFEEVISRFTDSVETPDKSAITDLLNAPRNLHTIAKSALNRLRTEPDDRYGSGVLASRMSPFDKRLGALSTVAFFSTTPLTSLLSVADVSGHRIGDEHWYTAEVDWLCVGPAYVLPAYPQTGIELVACQWRTRVLLSGSASDRITLLSSVSTSPLEDATAQEEIRVAMRRLWSPWGDEVDGPTPATRTPLENWLAAALMSVKPRRSTAADDLDLTQ